MPEAIKQSRTRVNARGAAPEGKKSLKTSIVPGQSVEDLGGPEVDNYKSTDDSAKMHAGKGAKRTSSKVNAGAKSAEAGHKLGKNIVWGEDVDLDDENELEEAQHKLNAKKTIWAEDEEYDEEDEISEASDEEDDEEEDDEEEDDEEEGEDEEGDSEEEGKHLAKKASEKMKKESFSLNVDEDVNALMSGEDLSEDFRNKAKLIFESAVQSKLQEEVQALEEAYAEVIAEELDNYKSELAEKVDAFLNYVCEEWLSENELAIENGLKLEIAESFMAGIKNVFEENYIEMPEEKVDILEEMANKLDEMEEKLNEQIERNIDLSEQVDTLLKESIVNDIASGLADSQKEKFVSLAESIEFDSEEEFVSRLETIKESYFPQNQARLVEDAFVGQDHQLNESMSAYVQAISRWSK